MHNWLIIWHGMVHWTGGDYGAPAYGYFEPYDELSGIAGLSLVGILYHNFKKNNCSARWCLRIGHHSYTDNLGMTHNLCRKHHPEHPGRRAMKLRHILDRTSD